jgi:hypothetical protein
MEDILKIFQKDKNNTIINGTFYINMNDEEIRTKSFNIKADSNYFKSTNITVELSSKKDELINLYKMDNNSINIWLIVDNTKILLKRFNNLSSDNKVAYNILISTINTSDKVRYITYLVNNNRQIFIFCDDKSNIIYNMKNQFKFIDITEDFSNSSLLYQLYNIINKL